MRTKVRINTLPAITALILSSCQTQAPKKESAYKLVKPFRDRILIQTQTPSTEKQDNSSPLTKTPTIGSYIEGDRTFRTDILPIIVEDTNPSQEEPSPIVTITESPEILISETQREVSDTLEKTPDKTPENKTSQQGQMAKNTPKKSTPTQ